MSNDSKSPATKGDIKVVMDSISGLFDEISNLRRWKDEIINIADEKILNSENRIVHILKIHIDNKNSKLEERISCRFEERMNESEERMMEHFNLVAENIHHNAAGANKDEIEVMKDNQGKQNKRISRLEKHCNLIAA